MAATMIRTSMKNIVLPNSVSVDLRFRQLRHLIKVQCSCYHTTPTLCKKKVTREEKKKMKILQQLEFVNPKIKEKKQAVQVWRNMSVRQLAETSRRHIGDVLQALQKTNPNHRFTGDSIFEDMQVLFKVVQMLGYVSNVTLPPDELEKNIKNRESLDAVRRPPPRPEDLVKRHPVVTIMGHVDHGKTTLLDSLRNSSVVKSEFGGITQHIGAFNVKVESGGIITFLDTPGHAAFSAMRARGANCTDIVILVVAADDGVMEQTVQSIRMAHEAKVPIIVAINKIDKPLIDIDRTKKMLAENDVHVEDLGGDVQSVNISALRGQNLDGLIEAIMTQSEVMGLKGDPSGLVEGVVIEASNDDKGRGKIATVLVQRGTLRKGDILVSGLAWAKVRAMFDHSGSPIDKAGPSDAVQIIGWRELPIAGFEILEVESEKRANQVMEYRKSKINEEKSLIQKQVADKKLEEHLVEYRKTLQKKRALGLRSLKPEGPKKKEYVPDDFPKVNIILKGDVVGSIEAILDMIDTYTDDSRCKLTVVHYGVGPVSKNDIELAKTFDAIIYTFNVKLHRDLKQEAKTSGVSVRYHNVIYRLQKDLKEEISQQLPMIEVEEEIGKANILQEFEINVKSKKVKVAGCRCTKGTLQKTERFKVLRGEEVIYNGEAEEIRHLKDIVQVVKNNQECGLRLKDCDVDFQLNDEVICYKIVSKPQKTIWNPGF